MFAILLLTFLLLIAVGNFMDSNVYGQTFILVILLLFVASVLANMCIRKKIRVKVEDAGTDRKAGLADCRITLTNASHFPVVMAATELVVTNTYTGQRQKKKVKMSVMPGRKSHVMVRIGSPHCGKLRCSVDKVSLLDLFGVTRINTGANAFCNYTILPDIFDTYIEYDLHESDLYDCDTYSPYRKGKDSSEVFQIREYAEGDSLRQIHWKLSGKTDTLVVKDSSMPMDKTLMVVMDKGVPPGEQCTPEVADAAAEIAVSVGQSLLDAGLIFEMVWNDPEGNICYSENIQFEESFGSLIPRLLTGRIVQTDISCGSLYNKLIGSCSATHVIYITCGTEVDAEQAFPKSRFIRLSAKDPDYKDKLREIRLY